MFYRFFLSSPFLALEKDLLDGLVSSRTTDVKAIIDGDVILYRTGFACQENKWTVEVNGKETFVTSKKRELNDWLERFDETSGDVSIRLEVIPESTDTVEYTVRAQINRIMEYTHSDEQVIYLSGTTNFRMEIYPEYKANRTSAKPVHWDLIRTMLIDDYGAEVVEGIEADDAIGIEATRLMDEGGDYVICTIDKDLDQIAGPHFDFYKDKYYTLTPEQAVFNFWCQVLSGDATDNVPGIRGVGKNTAQKLLHECKTDREYLQVVLSEYGKASRQGKLSKNPWDALVETGQLVYILRKKGERWAPAIPYVAAQIEDQY